MRHIQLIQESFVKNSPMQKILIKLSLPIHVEYNLGFSLWLSNASHMFW